MDNYVLYSPEKAKEISDEGRKTIIDAAKRIAKEFANRSKIKSPSEDGEDFLTT